MIAIVYLRVHCSLYPVIYDAVYKIDPHTNYTQIKMFLTICLRFRLRGVLFIILAYNTTFVAHNYKIDVLSVQILGFCYCRLL